MGWGGALSVASALRWIFDVVAFALTLASYFKVQSVKAAEKRMRHTLLNRMASQQFSGLAARAESLTLSVRSREWKRGAQEAVQLKGELTSAESSWKKEKLIAADESDRLKVAIREVELILQVMPIEPHDVTGEQTQAMMAGCDFLLRVVNEIAGRLKYPD